MVSPASQESLSPLPPPFLSHFFSSSPSLSLRPLEVSKKYVDSFSSDTSFQLSKAEASRLRHAKNIKALRETVGRGRDGEERSMLEEQVRGLEEMIGLKR